MKNYDVIVVGGGPSGSALGKLLADQGMAVVILEKKRFPRDKPCGGLVTPKCARSIAGTFGGDLLPRIARASSCGCRLFRDREFVAAGAIKQPTFFVDRREMDLALLTLARESGCTVREDSSVVGMGTDGSSVRLLSGEEISGNVVVGADGVNSVVRRTVWHTNSARHRNMGLGFAADLPLEAMFDAELRTNCAETPHVFFDVVSWGYGWIFPKGATVNVGVGGLLRRNPAMARSFRDFVATHFEPGTALSPRGHLVPYGSFERVPGRGNVLLVGDAAGLADPLTGEGLGAAFESARVAAEAIRTAIANGNPAQTGQIYCSAVNRVLFHNLRTSLLARSLLFPSFLLPFAMRTLRRQPSLVGEFLRLLSGEGRHRRLAGSLLASMCRRQGV